MTWTEVGAKVYGAVPMVRLNACSTFCDPDASTDDEEEEEELGYHPSSPKFTPIMPPGSPNKVSALIGKWEEEPEPEEEAA